MRKGLLFIVFVCTGFLMAQDSYEPFLIGNLGDQQKLKSQYFQKHEVTFVRLIYNGRIPGYLKNWYTDYPKGDRQIIAVLRRLTKGDIAPEERAITLLNPDLFLYPFLYVVEAGQMMFDEKEVKILREYFLRGGFMMVDDFWGSFEWDRFEHEIKKVFPDRAITELSRHHEIFHCLFDIDDVMQVPNVGYAYFPGSPTWELDGYKPHALGIFDDEGRLVVFINFNTDLMDAAEWADEPRYPHHFSAYAYKIFVNATIYAMSH